MPDDTREDKLRLGGMALASVGGYLGGHLAIARKVGTSSDVPTRDADQSSAKTSLP